MTEESLEKMKLWLELWSESLHDEDEKRKVDFVRSLKRNDETVDFDDFYNCYREVKPSIDENIAVARCLKWAEDIEKLLAI